MITNLPEWWPASKRFLYDDCRDVFKHIPDNVVDQIPTDPPYGLKFMGKNWDTFNEIVEPKGAFQSKKGFKKLPRQSPKAMLKFFVPIWRECLRILKPGAFAFVMCSPRQDVLSKQITALELAGFNVGFTSMYWTYSQGFPKAENISKAVDKQECKKRLIDQLGRKPTKQEFEQAWECFCTIVGVNNPTYDGANRYPDKHRARDELDVNVRLGLKKSAHGLPRTAPATDQAKDLEGAYAGFSPKPAIEVILVAMKPLSEKTYRDQALHNKKGVTWLDDCRIPYVDEADKESSRYGTQADIKGGNLKSPNGVLARNVLSSEGGRFPANLLVQDDTLNDGQNHNKGGDISNPNIMTNDVYGEYKKPRTWIAYGDSGSYSRYFDLDMWWTRYLANLPKNIQRTHPFLIVPKASKSEKNKGLDTSTTTNTHISVKPVRLMAYLITLGSREGDIVLDPFAGSGSTLVAADITHRNGLGIDNDPDMMPIADGRLNRENYKLEELW